MVAARQQSDTRDGPRSSVALGVLAFTNRFLAEVVAGVALVRIQSIYTKY
jgi:hypothetical protein